MCNAVQEYAEEYAKEYANQEKIKMLADMFTNGIITSQIAASQLSITEENFLEYVEEYNRI